MLHSWSAAQVKLRAGLANERVGWLCCCCLCHLLLQQLLLLEV
jgi:hypothetical protein